MSLTLNPLYTIGDKLLLLSENGGKTYFLLVKVINVAKAEIESDGTTYDISYNVTFFDKVAYDASQVPAVSTMLVKESDLITLTTFNNTYTTYI